MRIRRREALLLAGWAFLLLAWVIGNPPFAAPDEADHYVRAVGISSGHLLGAPAPGEPTGITPRQRAWTSQATRAVRVPAGLAVPADCYLRDAHRSAACRDAATIPAAPARVVTPVGTYQPLPYLLPAVTLRLAHDSRGALRWARAPGALVVLLLLMGAVVVLRDPGADEVRALLGPLVAVTPMVLYCGASLTGSGLEIAGAIALAAAVLRLTRGGRAPRPSPAAWAVLGVAGAVLTLSRSGSPLWTVLVLALAVALVGPRRALAGARRAGAPAFAALGAVAVAAVLNRAWEWAYGPHLDVPTRAIPLGVRTGIEQWGRAAQELVAGFGYLEYVLPLWLPLLWLALAGGLVALAWRGAAARERRVLGATALVAAVAPVALYVAVIRATGFGLQGRHVLPVVVVLPLLAGELLHRRRVAVPRGVLIALGVAAGAVQLAAFWLEARRSAVGVDGPLFFLGRAEWSPPLGWAAVLLLATAGAAAVAAAVVTPAATGRAPRRPSRASSRRSPWRPAAGRARTRAPR